MPTVFPHVWTQASFSVAPTTGYTYRVFPTWYAYPVWGGFDFIRLRETETIVAAVTHPTDTGNGALLRVYFCDGDDLTEDRDVTGLPGERGWVLIEPQDVGSVWIGETPFGQIDLIYSLPAGPQHRFSRDGGRTWSAAQQLPNVTSSSSVYPSMAWGGDSSAGTGGNSPPDHRDGGSRGHFAACYDQLGWLVLGCQLGIFLGLCRAAPSATPGRWDFNQAGEPFAVHQSAGDHGHRRIQRLRDGSILTLCTDNQGGYAGPPRYGRWIHQTTVVEVWEDAIAMMAQWDRVEINTYQRLVATGWYAEALNQLVEFMPISASGNPGALGWECYEMDVGAHPPWPAAVGTWPRTSAAYTEAAQRLQLGGQLIHDGKYSWTSASSLKCRADGTWELMHLGDDGAGNPQVQISRAQHIPAAGAPVAWV